jgi:hypothetical protein
VRLEELGELKNSNDLTGNRTRDLSACSIAILARDIICRGKDNFNKMLAFPITRLISLPLTRDHKP